jgi:predicted nucleic acid-binding protein
VILYLDSSALVKLFVEEEGSQAVRAAVGAAADCYTHLIAYAEVRAALARAVRMGRSGPEQLELHKRELVEIWQALGIVVPDERLVRQAGDLAEQFGLRGYDSMHLSAAHSLASCLDPAVDFRFAAFDRALLGAARSLGMGPVQRAPDAHP